jgi:hypothetical protein
MRAERKICMRMLRSAKADMMRPMESGLVERGINIDWREDDRCGWDAPKLEAAHRDGGCVY